MAEKLADAVIYLTTDDSKLKTGLNNAESEVKKSGGMMGNLLKGGLAVGATAAVAAVGGLVYAFRNSISEAREAIEVEKQLDAVLLSTGGSAGLTAEEIKKMASGLQEVTNFGDDAIMAGQNMLLTFTNIGRDVFPQATETMLNMSQAMGQDMNSSAIQLGKALNDPIAGVGALSRVGVQFTEEQKNMIAVMMEAGDIAGAQAVILGELETQFGGSARALADPAIQLQNAWGDFQEEVGKVIIPLLNDLAQKALPLVIQAMTWFTEEGVPALREFGDVVKNVVTFVMGIFTNLGAVVDEQGTGRFQYFQTWIDENMPRIQQIVERVLGAITAFWTEHGETIMHVVNNTFGVIFTVIETTLKFIMESVQFFLQVFTGDWEGAGETLKGIVTLLWDAIKNIFRLELDSLRTIFNEVDWIELGKSIMIGVAMGILNAHSIIIDAARSAAKSAYEAAKGWLGIGSPSKLTEEKIGKPFAQGIAVGIGKELSAMKIGMGMGLGGLVGSMGAGSMATAAAGPTYNITIPLSGSASYEDGRMVARGLQDELRARGLA